MTDTFIEDLQGVSNLPATASPQVMSEAIDKLMALFTGGKVREWWRAQVARWRADRGLPEGTTPPITWNSVRTAMRQMTGRMLSKAEQARTDLATGVYKQTSGQTVAQYVTAFTSLYLSASAHVDVPMAITFFVSGLRAPLDKICQTTETGAQHATLESAYLYAQAKERELGAPASRAGAARVQVPRRGRGDRRKRSRHRSRSRSHSRSASPTPPSSRAGGFKSNKGDRDRGRERGGRGGGGAGPSHGGAGPSHGGAGPSHGRGAPSLARPPPGVSYTGGRWIIDATQKPACWGCLNNHKVSAWEEPHMSACPYKRAK